VVRWGAYWPDWQDTDRRVEIEVGGVRFAGRLTAEEEPGGDGANFSLELDDGTTRTFADNDRWRFLS
jgi:hypothetical protein